MQIVFSNGNLNTNKTMSDCVFAWSIHFELCYCKMFVPIKMRFLMKGFSVRNLHTQNITGSSGTL